MKNGGGAVFELCESCCEHFQSDAGKKNLLTFSSPAHRSGQRDENTSISSLINIHVGSHERQ